MGGTVDRQGVGRWLDRYVEAWRRNERETIEDLFTSDASYRYRPTEEPLRGREAIAESWLAEADEPGTWDAWYEPYAVEGDAAVAVGVSSYFGEDGKPERVFDNVFVLRFDPEGRCAEFREWFMERPKE
jgi:SnoaL-like protein